MTPELHELSDSPPITGPFKQGLGDQCGCLSDIELESSPATPSCQISGNIDQQLFLLAWCEQHCGPPDSTMAEPAASTVAGLGWTGSWPGYAGVAGFWLRHARASARVSL